MILIQFDVESLSMSVNFLPHNPDFKLPLGESCLKPLQEMEKMLVTSISPFPIMFSTLFTTEFIILESISLLSANALNLALSKNLLFSKGLSA